MKFLRMLAWLTAFGTLLMFVACTQKAVIPDSGPGRNLFSMAENQYNQGFHNSALNLYQDYLDGYPQGENVSAAFLRVGDVYFARGEYTQARRQYGRVVERYPETRFSEDARIGVLLSWYNEQEYRRVLDYADTIDDERVSDDCVARKYAAVSDAYLAMGDSGDAAYVLISGLRKVGAPAQKKILVKLNQISDKIGPQALQKLLDAVKAPGFRGYLSCQIADRYIQQENYEQAVMVLSDLITNYPDNAYAAQAVEMMRQIDKASVYDAYAIGCLLPLSGSYRLFGERALKGIQFAFQEFVVENTRRGTALPIKLIIGDTGSTSEKAVLAVKRLADKKVAAIIGPLGPFKAAILEAEKQHIPIITLSQEENIPAIGKYVYRNFLTPQMQIDSLVDYACQALGMRKFAVLYPDEEYGRVFAHKFWDEILKYGGEMVGFEAYDPTETDFAAPIKKLAGLYYTVPESLQEIHEQRLISLGLKVEESYFDDTIPLDWAADDIIMVGEDGRIAKYQQGMEEQEVEEDEEEEVALVDFDALFIPDGPSNAGLIIPQLAFYDVVETQLMGTHLWYNPELIETAGWYAQTAVFPAAFWEGDNSAAGQSFSLHYERFYNEKPGFISAVAYDSAVILMNIINDADVRFRHSIIDRLGDVDSYPGITGLTAFDMNGEVRKELTLLKIKGRRFVKIDKVVPGFEDEVESPPDG